MKSRVNNSIYLYGQDRQQPIINSYQEREIYQGKLISTLTINGVIWCIDSDVYATKHNQTEWLELRSLLRIERDYSFIVETAIINTPFISVRVKRDYKQKGHIVLLRHAKSSD